MRPMIDRIKGLGRGFLGLRASSARPVYGARGLGFTYKSELFVWTKVTKAGLPRIGTGLGNTRKTSETVWLATRSKGLKSVDRGVSESILTQRREHSRRPDEVYEALERLLR
jgi:N6-adenosine-specific RNA methylase IME4